MYSSGQEHFVSGYQRYETKKCMQTTKRDFLSVDNCVYKVSSYNCVYKASSYSQFVQITCEVIS